LKILIEFWRNLEADGKEIPKFEKILVTTGEIPLNFDEIPKAPESLGGDLNLALKKQSSCFQNSLSSEV